MQNINMFLTAYETLYTNDAFVESMAQTLSVADFNSATMILLKLCLPFMNDLMQISKDELNNSDNDNVQSKMIKKPQEVEFNFPKSDSCEGFGSKQSYFA
jgi:hypothetical protein